MNDIAFIVMVFSLLFWVAYKIIIANIRHSRVVKRYFTIYKSYPLLEPGIEEGIGLIISNNIFNGKNLDKLRSEMIVMNLFNTVYPRRNFWITGMPDGMELETIILEISNKFNVEVSTVFNEKSTIRDLAQYINITKNSAQQSDTSETMT